MFHEHTRWELTQLLMIYRLNSAFRASFRYTFSSASLTLVSVPILGFTMTKKLRYRLLNAAA